MNKIQSSVHYEDSLGKNYEVLELLNPKIVYIELDNSKSKSHTLNVAEGDVVKKYQQIGVRDCGFYKQNIFSPVSGKVIGKQKRFTPSGKLYECLAVENDMLGTEDERYTNIDDEALLNLTKDEIISKVEDNALVGLGGGAFPTFIKLKNVSEVLLVNGIECEPGVLSDYKTLINRAEEVVKGTVLAMIASGAAKAYICIDKAYNEATPLLEAALEKFASSYDIRVKEFAHFYPQGWENNLVKKALGLTLDGAPYEKNILVLNATTVVGITRACKHNVTLTSRQVTLVGEMFKKDSIVKTLIGTPLNDLIELIGGYKNDDNKVLIYGGPMMGQPILVDSGITTILTTSIQSFKAEDKKTSPCIRCSNCVKYCPAGLAPTLIAKAGKVKNADAVKSYHADKCIECGLCSFVCPSLIEVTTNVKNAKKLIKA